MALSNIEKFNDQVGKIFADLYAAFPLPITLCAKDFVPNGQVLTTNAAGDEVISDEAYFFMATGSWLIKAGYFTAVEFNDGDFGVAILTAKGLEALKAMPDSLQGKESLGEQLVDAAKTEGREVIRSLVSQALGIGLQLLVR